MRQDRLDSLVVNVERTISTKCFLLLSVRIPTLRQSGNYAQQFTATHS